MSLPSPVTIPQQRLYWVDWLRVLAMVGIFLFHNARFFNAFEDWQVKNSTTNLGATGLVAFMSQWIMPLFFLIAGAGTYYALKSRQPGQYAKERTLRLFVPLVFGILVVVVPQAYFQALNHGQQLSQYSFFQIYSLYLQSVPDINTFPGISAFHLWFLADLFLFSIITIPLFFTGRDPGKNVITKLATFLDRPWALLLLFIMSIAIVNMLIYPDGFWGYRNGGWNPITYLFFFVFGYLIFANPRILETIRKLRWFSLLFGIITFAFILWYDLTIGSPAFGSLMYALGMLIQAMGTWGWLFAILGFGSLYLTQNTRFLSYANEAVLPFYVLHQTVIIVIGFYVVQWNAGVGLKYLVISTTSFAGIMLIYEFLVRHINVVRFLFGMRQRRRTLRKAMSAFEKGT